MLKRSSDWTPRLINADKNLAYRDAITYLKQKGAMPAEGERRQ